MKKYKIREGSIADHAICISPILVLILAMAIGSAITGTW